MEGLLVSKLKRWTCFTTINIKNDKELKECKRVIDVDEEYQGAIRSKSFADFFSKAQLLVQDPSLSMTQSYCHHKVLLEPDQETIATILESKTMSKNSNLKVLILDYFAISSEASKICMKILKSITQVRSSYVSNQQTLNIFIEDRINNNPIYKISKNDFEVISNKYSSALQKMKVNRRKVDRKLKMISYFNKASGICMTATCGLVAVAAMALAAHTLTALVMGPMIFTLPMKSIKKKVGSLKFLKSRILRRVADQLDVAMKGTYILNRDFDTMSRLVNRLHDEIERNRWMMELYLERGHRGEDKICLQILRELEKSHVWFRKQVDELEEQVYLCLLTINKGSELVIKELSKSCEKRPYKSETKRCQ
ncbi:hypothetical protein LXL04_031230 [Taraxacum kok-saghyz]